MPKVCQLEVLVKNNSIIQSVEQIILLLRWNKPSGRLILLIPALWSLWLSPAIPPGIGLTSSIIAGGLFISGAGCIANDLWDRKIDREVPRTKQRPLASGNIRITTALILLLVMLLLSLLVVTNLPTSNRFLCLGLASLALLPILIYPSAKRWFKYPQAFLAICWGFAVLLPWAASQGNLSGGWPLYGCWGATIMWTFGFDTVYAMADCKYDKQLGLHSSVLSLQKKVIVTVAISYLIACSLLAIAAASAGVTWTFWPTWATASILMQREIWVLRDLKFSIPVYGKHFQHQVWLGGLLLLGLIIGRIS